MICQKYSFHVIFVLKVIFMFYCIHLGSTYLKITGFKFFRPSTSPWGVLLLTGPPWTNPQPFHLIVNAFWSSWYHFQGFSWCWVHLWHFQGDQKWLSLYISGLTYFNIVFLAHFWCISWPEYTVNKLYIKKSPVLLHNILETMLLLWGIMLQHFVY